MARKGMGDLAIGTSGWTYDGWRGPFYPPEIPKRQWLAWYSMQFATTEINGSFYRTPSLEAVRAWREQTPDDFQFAWKASKFITHWKRLSRDCKSSLALMETRLNQLGPKLGTVLFQLPARFKADRERLASFLKLLKRKHRYAFEFRDASWYEPAIFDLLRDHDVALCLSDHRDAPAPWEVTASHVYLSAATARPANTRTDIREKCCRAGRIRFAAGGGRGAMWFATLITTRRALRRWMPGRW
jgi:uncharacterized protein YecE (DUF72 family)